MNAADRADEKPVRVAVNGQVPGARVERMVTEARGPDGTRRVDLAASGAVIDGDVNFFETRFERFFCHETTFSGTVAATAVEFNEASFFNAKVEGSLWLDNCRARALGIDRVVAHGDVELLGVSCDYLVLDRSIFESPVRAEVAADQISCLGTHFRQGMDLNARWAEIIIDETRFGDASVIAYLDEEQRHEEALAERLLNARRSEIPRVVSVRRANVDGLLLSGVDLRACRFVKAHNLDRLRLENDVAFARTTNSRWARRRLVSEEAHWRAHYAGGAWRAFYDAECKPPDWLVREDARLEDPFDARLVATIYRSLRKGREDAKDEPGAADFYYGEMEMRRHDHTGPLVERAILWLYWLVSGYGLRASRALVALLATVLLFAALLNEWGFEQPRSFGRATLVSIQSTTSLLRAVDQPFTPEGEVMVTALRVIGPVLFGLMLLSLRGRVKR